MGERFDGKVAIITGGASGIGVARGCALARQGAQVILADRQEALAADVARQIGSRARGVALDVRDLAATPSAVMALLALSALSACGGARPILPSAPTEPASAEVDRDLLGVALEALLAVRYCEPDVCVDPFPIAGIERWARHGDRIAIAGVGALVGLYEAGEWHIERAPSGAAIYDVGFAPDGTLFAVGELGGLFVREGASWRALVPPTAAEDRYSEGFFTAVLPLAANDVWLATSLGDVLRWNGEALETVGHGDHAIDRLWTLAPDRLAAAGLYSTSIYDGSAWTEVTTGAQNTRYEEASGCVAWEDEDGEGEGEYDGEGEGEGEAEPPANEPPRFAASDPSPPWPDRTMRGWIDALDADRIARFAPWLETPPTQVSDLASDGAQWIAAGRDAGGVRFWSRMGELTQGSLGALDAGLAPAVSLSGDVAFVAMGDRVVRLDAASRAAPELARTLRIGGGGLLVDVLAVSPDDAFVLTDTGDVLRVTGGVASFAHRAGRPLRALGGTADDLYAVGPGGAIVHFDGATWTSITSGSTVDLSALHVPRRGEAYVSGAAGTVLVIEDGVARTVPRGTHTSFVDIHAEGGVVLVLTASGDTMRWDGTAWSEQARGLSRDGVLEAMRWIPEGAGGWQPVAAVHGPALDEPGAVLPYGAVRGWLHETRTRTDDPDASGIAAPSYLREALEYTDGCCDGGPTGDEDWAQIERRETCAEEPDDAYCHLEPSDDLGIDESHGVALRLVDARSDTSARGSDAPCVPLRIEVIRLRDAHVMRTSPTFECTGSGTLGRDTAAWQHLADPAYDPFEPWTSTGTYERGPTPASRGGELFVHRTASEDALVFVDEDNRVATPILAVPRRGAPSDAWASIAYWSVSRGGAFTVLSAELGREHFVWIGPTPIKLGMRPADGPPPGDVATCAELLVHDDDGATRLREQPRSASPTLSELANGTRLHVDSRRGGWIRVSSPMRGWVFRDNVRCAGP